MNPKFDTDSKETFEFGPDRPYVEGKPFTGATFAPTDRECPDFTRSNKEFLAIVMESIVPSITRALAVSLGLGESSFLRHISKEEMLITHSVAYYGRGKSGCGRHVDGSAFTVIMQEHQNGESSLKLFSRNMWTNVISDPNLIVIIFGRVMEAWSENRYMGTPHQVVHKGESDRVSIPVTVYPAKQTMIKLPGKFGRESTLSMGEIYLMDHFNMWKRSEGWKATCDHSKIRCECWRCS